MRKLIEAAVYRKFLFDSLDEMYEYIKSGHRERWLIDVVEDGKKFEAIIGETYNVNDPLMMEAADGNKSTD